MTKNELQTYFVKLFKATKPHKAAKLYEQMFAVQANMRGELVIESENELENALYDAWFEFHSKL